MFGILTFAVDDDVPVAEVLADWTRAVADELFGLGVHHALRARFSIERGRPWFEAQLLELAGSPGSQSSR